MNNEGINSREDRKRPLWNQVYRLIKGKFPPDGYAYNSLAYNALKPLRKWVTVTLVPSCPFNTVRIALYRACGFKIGANTFIGMRCYLDDMCHDLLTIGDNVIISYGVFFACHGRNQGHWPIEIQDGAYIGMRATVISKNKSGREGVLIGRNSVVGACTLVNCDVPDNSTAVGIPCRIIRG